MRSARGVLGQLPHPVDLGNLGGRSCAQGSVVCSGCWSSEAFTTQPNGWILACRRQSRQQLADLIRDVRASARWAAGSVVERVTAWPRSTRPMASAAARVVLPTPPFPIVRMTPLPAECRRAELMAVRGQRELRSLSRRGDARLMTIVAVTAKKLISAARRPRPGPQHAPSRPCGVPIGCGRPAP